MLRFEFIVGLTFHNTRLIERAVFLKALIEKRGRNEFRFKDGT